MVVAVFDHHRASAAVPGKDKDKEKDDSSSSKSSRGAACAAAAPATASPAAAFSEAAMRERRALQGAATELLLELVKRSVSASNRAPNCAPALLPKDVMEKKLPSSPQMQTLRSLLGATFSLCRCWRLSRGFLKLRVISRLSVLRSDWSGPGGYPRRRGRGAAPAEALRKRAPSNLETRKREARAAVMSQVLPLKWLSSHRAVRSFRFHRDEFLSLLRPASLRSVSVRPHPRTVQRRTCSRTRTWANSRSGSWRCEPEELGSGVYSAATHVRLLFDSRERGQVMRHSITPAPFPLAFRRRLIFW